MTHSPFRYAARSVLMLIALSSALPTLANNAPDDLRSPERSCALTQELEGSWLYSASLPIPDSEPFVFLGTETYSSGGAYSEADQLSFTPVYLATPGHGAWKSTGDHAYLLTYRNLTYNQDGTPSGSSMVRQKMKLSADGTKYSGSGDYFYYDTNDKVVASGTFTITAKKIQVQRPAQ